MIMKGAALAWIEVVASKQRLAATQCFNSSDGMVSSLKSSCGEDCGVSRWQATLIRDVDYCRGVGVIGDRVHAASRQIAGIGEGTDDDMGTARTQRPEDRGGLVVHGAWRGEAIRVSYGGQPSGDVQLLWFAGVIECFGGLLLAIGLFTRPVAFIMSGEMAVGYFLSHFPKSFFPLLNGGDAAVLYCFIFFFIFVVGGGCWSVDATLRRN
jgi:uncharacterized membrane protein YphA (DoxX/SURF4 family)